VDTFFEVAGGVITAVAGWATAWANMRGKVNAAEERSTTAVQQANTAIGVNAAMNTRLSVLEVEVRHLREAADQMVTREVLTATTATQTSELRRYISRQIPAARREEDSDPPSQLPPMRARLPSRREG
jgi:hypothetical protein